MRSRLDNRESLGGSCYPWQYPHSTWACAGVQTGSLPLQCVDGSPYRIAAEVEVLPINEDLITLSPGYKLQATWIDVQAATNVLLAYTRFVLQVSQFATGHVYSFHKKLATFCANPTPEPDPVA
jgi:hypothetical protein